MICLCAGPAAAQVEVPPEVQSPAVAAVNELGKHVVLGRFQVAIDRMYPQWKEQLSKRAGGMDKLQEQLAGAGKDMAAQGIQILSFRAVDIPTAYEVDAGKEIVQQNGKPVETMIFKKWLLLIPTVTEFRFTPPAKPGELPKARVVVSKGFQVAISEKGKNDWTFIDGSGIRVSDLRRLFFTLPENLELPEIKQEEKKDN